MTKKKQEALKLALEYRESMPIEVLHSWAADMKKAAQDAMAEQPAQQREPDTKDVVINNMGRPFTVKAYTSPQPAQQHIEHCLWARNGNQPCPHVQPAQQQEPVAAETTIDIFADHEGTVYATEFLPSGTKLYTSPQPSKQG